MYFSTRAGSRRERARQWSAATQAQNIELEDDQDASIWGGDIGSVRVCAVTTGRYRMFNERTCGARRDDATIKVIFQEEGECLLEQGGRALRLHPGQWCAYQKARPHRVTAAGPSRQLALVLPCASSSGRSALARRLLLARSFREGAGGVLHAAARSAMSAIDTLSPDDGAGLGKVLADLIEVALTSDEGAPDPTTPSARRNAAAEYIDRRLSDPDLDVAAVARALGCSKRTLHKMFVDQSATVGRLILARRLERCRSDLIDPRMAPRRITDIAHSWGFNDLQHFSRAFKARFGVSPRGLRAEALARRALATLSTR